MGRYQVVIIALCIIIADAFQRFKSFHNFPLHRRPLIDGALIRRASDESRFLLSGLEDRQGSRHSATSCYRRAPLLVSVYSSTALRVGRRRDELGLSKRQCFLRIRDLVEQAVLSGRFNDTSIIKPEVYLYCKSNIDCTQMGSSLEAQFLQMMLIHKEIPFESILISPLLIPPGIAAPPLNGRLPSLVHKDFRSSDPIEAARYLEAAFPDISLSQPSASDCDAIYAKVHSLYPAFYKYIVNKDAGLDDALRISAFTELDRVDQLLQRTPGRYIGGVDMTWVDLLLAPTLFHIAVGSEHIKGSKVYNYQYTPTRPAVENYLTRMLASSLFKDKRAYVHIEKIVHSWKMARGDAKLPYVPNLNMKLLGPSEPIQLTPSSPSTRVLSSEHNISAKIDGTLAVSVAQSGDSDGGHAVKNPRGRTAASSKVSAAPAGASLPASDAIISTSSSGGVDLDPAVITEPLSQSLSTSTPSPPPTRRRNRAVPDASSSLPETSESKSSRHSKGVSKTSTRSKASVSATTRRSSKGGVEGKKAKATRVSTKTPRVKE